jgi:hypothetical protein
MARASRNSGGASFQPPTQFTLHQLAHELRQGTSLRLGQDGFATAAGAMGSVRVCHGGERSGPDGAGKGNCDFSAITGIALS